jgi:hypothetical protein
VNTHTQKPHVFFPLEQFSTLFLLPFLFGFTGFFSFFSPISVISDFHQAEILDQRVSEDAAQKNQCAEKNLMCGKSQRLFARSDG